MADQAKSMKVCFQEGADARARGVKLAENPYDLRTDAHAEWAAGWCATFDLDEDRDPGSMRENSDGSS